MSLREETLLWQFIDGECSPEEAQQVCRMLETNQELQIAFDKLLRMHEQLQSLGNRGAKSLKQMPPAGPAGSAKSEESAWATPYHQAILFGLCLLSIVSIIRLIGL